MALIGTLTSGVSSLKTFSKGLEVIGNNIANVNTTGFKSSRVTFKEAFVQLLQGASRPPGNTGGINPIQIGTGTATLADVAPDASATLVFSLYRTPRAVRTTSPRLGSLNLTMAPLVVPGEMLRSPVPATKTGLVLRLWPLRSSAPPLMKSGVVKSVPNKLTVGIFSTPPLMMFVPISVCWKPRNY